MQTIAFLRTTNIYEQQTRNRRNTIGLVFLFILLITAVGVGFDLLFHISYAWRIIMLPSILLTVISGLRSFRNRAMTRLWNNSWIDEEEGDGIYWVLSFRIVIGSFLLIALMPVIFNPDLADRMIRDVIDIPFLRWFPIGTSLAAVVGIVCAATSIRWGPSSILWSLRAEGMEDIPDRFEELNHIVDEMRLAAGIPTPQLYIVNDRDPNAFAIGAEPGSSVIVVTTGLLSLLPRDELQAVIAHEMSHIRNQDTRLMTTVTVLFGAVLLLSQWLRRAALFGGISGMRVPGLGIVMRLIYFLVWLITLLFAPIIVRIVAMTVSREREYLADASAAELTRDPKALARALARMEKAEDPTMSFTTGVAQLCIVDPLGRRINSKEGFWADLFATHPPMSKRILLLNAIAYEPTS